jgi:Raf kinase inhibitor-like YbhB/YbcL family protein
MNGGTANGGNGGTANGGNGGTAMGGAGGAGGANAMGGTGGSTGGTAAFALTSSAFMEGQEIPLKYKCAEVPPVGMNISPPLSWGPGPAGTMSYAIILMHIPSPEHWVIWDIPANVTSLPEDIEHAPSPAMPAGAKQSTVNLDGFNGPGYLGPCPQAHNVAQTYQFTLYALDVATLPGLTATSTPAEAATVVKAHVVAGSQGVTLSGTQIQVP